MARLSWSLLLVPLLAGSGLAAQTVLGELGVDASTAHAKDDKGRPVTIRVVDEYGNPIPNARVRVPNTEGKTLVNRNGEWTESMLYTLMGDEFVFEKNAFIEFHVSAPEFYARSVKYRVRGRMNYVEVALRKMPAPTEELGNKDDRDLLIHWFKRTEVEDVPEGGGQDASATSDEDGEE